METVSREALEQALEDHEGTMLIVSHDRYLINRLADRILAFTEHGIKEYIGGYDDYIEALSSVEAESEKDDAKDRDNDYKAQKKKQSALNLASGEVKRAEERISQAESEMSELNCALAENATDYTKAQKLMKEVEAKQKEIDELYSRWEDSQKKLEELQNES